MSQDTPSNGHAPTFGDPDPDGWVARLAVTATNAEGCLWSVVGATLLFDVALTALGLELGLSEANPVAATFVDRFGVLVALTGLKFGALCTGFVGWVAVSRRHRGLVPLGLALPWGAATIVNVVTIGAQLL
jgi:hypothetical protein